MASTIVTKNSSTASAVPVTGDLTQGELAVNVTDKKLYTKDSGGTVVKLVGGLGNQEANAVAITGGSINGTTVGATAASTGAFTTLSASSTTTLSGGTANGVAYLNGSKVVTTGSALTFDGTTLATTGKFGITGSGSVPTSTAIEIGTNGAGSRLLFNVPTGGEHNFNVNGSLASWVNATSSGWYISGSEAMRLTSTGLGIGTSSPSYKLDVSGTTGISARVKSTSGSTGNYAQLILDSYNSFSGSGQAYIRGVSSASGNSNTDLTFGVNASGFGSPYEAMRLDSSGNLGLGVTPSAWISSGKAIDIAGFGSVAQTSSGSLASTFNAYQNSAGNWIYKTTNAAAQYQCGLSGLGQHAWFTAASGTAGNAITFTQAMTLDASGNLGIGTTSPSNRLSVAGSTGTIASFTNGATADFSIICGSSITSLNAGGANILAFQTGGTERARIDSSGNLLIGRTATGLTTAGAGINKNAGGAYFEVVQGGNGVACMYANQSYGSGSQTAFDIRFNNTQVGTINVTSTTCTFNNLSDYRLKDVIGPVAGHGDRIDLLEPIEYAWKSTGELTRGFLAHKFQEIYPTSVSGKKDDVDDEGNPKYQTMQASTAEVIADLVAEIKSLRARVAQLEAK